MLKDIQEKVSEGVTLAAIYELDSEQQMVWNIYLLNYKDVPIEGVLIMSRGYGERNGEEITTSTLRHFVEKMPEQSVARIEPIDEDVFSITNEYLVTYYEGPTLFEKKFVFESYAISQKNLVFITFIGQQGIELL
jgi:hypothetical protein